ncbi:MULTISPECIES: TIGR02611 family protein [unclassified Knoellia]|uniref:TIGR02611 family protein n=1 Tax=Knoellia altitudinis TaxID=3404795 RepID=UPI00362286D3
MSVPPPAGEAREDVGAEQHADAPEDDWAWRRRLRANPTTAKVYRIGVFIAGLLIVVVGLALIPFPGPGWLIVIAGLAIWATEFERAQRVLEFVKKNLRMWEEWVKRQNLFVKGLVGVVGLVFIATVLWLTFHFSGIPGFFPDGLESWMRTTARI